MPTCWAASLSPAAMNDDGEPSGTAGKPIFNVIQHKGDDVLVVVTRYFGGVKLGPGLVRAYAAAAESVLAEVEVESVPQVLCRLEMGFAQEQRLRHWAACHDGQVEEVSYGQSVVMTLRFPRDWMGELEQLCAAEQIQIALP